MAPQTGTTVLAARYQREFKENKRGRSSFQIHYPSSEHAVRGIYAHSAPPPTPPSVRAGIGGKGKGAVVIFFKMGVFFSAFLAMLVGERGLNFKKGGCPSPLQIDTACRGKCTVPSLGSTSRKYPLN